MLFYYMTYIFTKIKVRLLHSHHLLTGRHFHPYCARSSEEWLSWNIGKRRASEVCLTDPLGRF